VDEALRLSDRTFRCRNPHVSCGLVMDRDLNAAINLSKLANLAGSSSERRNACGGKSAGCGLTGAVELSSLKQEPTAR
jgi:transposase